MLKLFFSILVTTLLLTGLASADPCDGRNPLYCQRQPGPIIVQDVRVRPQGSLSTTHNKVISQDGRVLMVIKGPRTNYNISDVEDEPNYEQD